MKFKTTRKEILNNYDTVISVGYCSMQYLLRYQSAMAYTCGVYGWNADIYYYQGCAIVTGYRPFGKRVDYAIVDKYEKMAKDVSKDYTNSYEYNEAKINSLLDECLRELLKKQ